MSVVRASLAASLPGYDLGGELGRGGWGVVRDGRRRQNGRAVAIKELPAAFAADRLVRSRFVQEAQLVASVTHPHLVPLVEFVERDGVCVLVMDQLTGGSVWGDFVVNGITQQRACAIALAAASGLHAAHLNGVLHRDLKPENLMYTADGTLQVADLGLARIIGGSDTVATAEGAVLGTPAYLAPEQALGHGAGAGTDVYALGTILYELLSGSLPFLDDGNPLVTLRRHVDERPVPLELVAPSLPTRLIAAVMRAISRHLDDRQPSAEAFGVEVAEAAVLAWGPNWLAESGGPKLLADDAIRAAAVPVAGATSRADPPTPHDEAVTWVASSSGPIEPADGAVAAPSESAVFDQALVDQPEGPGAMHPNVIGHPVGGAAAAVTPEQTLPVRTLIVVPQPPTPFMLGAALATLLTILICWFGFGSPTHDGGFVIGVADPMSIDFDQPVDVTLPGPPTRLAAVVSIAGVDVARVLQDSIDAGGGDQRATFDLSHVQYLVAGRSTLSLYEATSAGDVRIGALAVDSAHNGWITAPAIGAVIVALVALAYGEAMLSPSRRGRIRIHHLIGLGITGAIFGGALYAIGWVVRAPEPTRAGAVVCAATTATAAVLYAVGRARWVRRRQSHRATTYLAAQRAAAARHDAAAKKRAAREAAT
jgi:serine/threonine-protein kinase